MTVTDVVSETSHQDLRVDLDGVTTVIPVDIVKVVQETSQIPDNPASIVNGN